MVQGAGWAAVMSARRMERPLGLFWTYVSSVAGFELEAEEVGGVAFVEDEEDLGEEAVALGGLEDDGFVDVRLEEGQVGFGHGGWLLRVGLTGARKLTVLRMTIWSRWLKARVRVRTMP